MGDLVTLGKLQLRPHSTGTLDLGCDIRDEVGSDRGVKQKPSDCGVPLEGLTSRELS